LKFERVVFYLFVEGCIKEEEEHEFVKLEDGQEVAYSVFC